MDDWQYMTKTVSAEVNEIDLEVEHAFNHWQDAGWDYVGGPGVSWDGNSPRYTFLLRRRRQQRSAYEDHDLTVI